MSPPATPWTELSIPETPYTHGLPSSGGTDIFVIFLFETDMVDATTPYTEMSIAATPYTEDSIPVTPWTKFSI